MIVRRLRTSRNACGCVYSKTMYHLQLRVPHPSRKHHSLVTLLPSSYICVTPQKCTLQSPYLFSYEYYTPTERADLIASKKATLMLTGSAHRKGAVGLEVFEGNGGVSCYTCGSVSVYSG